MSAVISSSSGFSSMGVCLFQVPNAFD